jgi:hypothetical protein
MRNYLRPLVLVSSVMLMLVGTVLPVRPEDRLLEGAMILAPAGPSARMANDSDDTLTACLARIPAQVTPQQRMLAQQMCQKEEATRKLIPPAVKER